MNILVIGHGSIGSRHARTLKELGCHVSLVTSQHNESYLSYNTIEAAFKNNFFDQVVIANPTHLHQQTLEKMLSLSYQGTILVEKPLFSKMKYLRHANFDNIYVAYNLRFHALIQNLRILLQNDALISFSVQVGSYLPGWRKNSDYRNCYSAKQECGGGVLRDLSHELDYILWLCGQCIEVTAIGGHYSDLEITSDDIYAILMRCEHCPIVNLQLDYLNKTPTRQITIQTKKHNTIFLDLIKGDLYINGKITIQVQDAIHKTYITQHELMIKNELTDFCNYSQGLSVVKLIASIEEASFKKKWINL